MNNTRDRQLREFRETLYPAFSRRATQVCILSGALEAIAKGAPDAQAVALAALHQADAFGWRQRHANSFGTGSTPSAASHSAANSVTA